MPTVNVQPMQWKPVEDIAAVSPFSPEDAECFRELRDVLHKYGALDRFGISLIHRHFDVEADEEMVEFTDLESRTLTVRPVKKSEIDWKSATVTNWKLTQGGGIAATRCVCTRNLSSHFGTHQTVP